MRAWDELTGAAVLAAAGSRGRSLLRRACYNAGHAVGFALIAGQAVAPAAWYVTVLGLMVLDAWIGKAFVQAPGRYRKLFSFAYVACSIATISAFMGMALSCALLGGAEGKFGAYLMATGSIVTIMVLMVEAPLLLVLNAAPGALLLLLLVLMPQAASAGSTALASTGLVIIFGTFVWQLSRASVEHIKTNRRLHEALATAEANRMEAERASAAKSEFLRMMTHELRTPLNAVINYSEIIEEDSDGDVQEDAKRITGSARHLLGLIDRVLDFSDLEFGSVRFRVEPVDITIVARESVAAHEADLSKSGTVGQVHGVSSVFAMVDRVRVRQCIDCLVSNAVRFTRAGNIVVRVECKDDFALVFVEDTGEGISRERLADVFEPFKQIDGSMTRSSGGIGLGLPIGRLIARGMGGDIEASSTPGSGSRFTLRLPRAQEQGGQTPLRQT